MSSHQRKRRRAGPESATNDASYEDGVDIRLFSPDNAEQVKRYIREILEHPRSITRIKFDGSITITPNPRLLPNNVIATILLHVSKSYHGYAKTDLFQCALVNKQFYMHANTLLWQDYILLAGDKMPTWFISCLENGRRHLGYLVRNLHICGGGSGSGDWTDLLLLRLIQHIPHLDTLSMFHTSTITDASFQYLPRLCARLTNLTFKSCRSLSQPSFAALGQYCHQLRKLTFYQCQHLPADLFAMLRMCPLEDIHISYYNITMEEGNDGGDFMSDRSMESLKQFHRLTHLKIEAPFHRPSAITTLLSPMTTTTMTALSAPPFGFVGPPVVPSTAHIAYHWPQLKELDLAPCTTVDDATLIGFLQCHPLLTTLELRSAPLVTDASLSMMTTQWLPHLTRIKWRDAVLFSPEGVRHFLRHSSPSLVSAIFDRCDRLSTSDLTADHLNNNNNNNNSNNRNNSNYKRRDDHIDFDQTSIVRMRQQGRRQEEEEEEEEEAVVIVVEQRRGKSSENNRQRRH